MTTIRAFTIIAALATASAAFADPAAPPAKKPDAPAADKTTKKGDTVSEADAQKFLAFFDKLVAIVVANQDDCAKMAAGIAAHVDANQALLKTANEARSQNKELPPAIKEKIEKKAKEEFAPAVTKKCGGDKDVQAALMRMGPGKH